MSVIILGLFLLWALWGLGGLIVDKTRNAIEDRAIKKAGVKEALDNATQGIINRVDPQIMHTKEAVSDFRKFVYENLPGLEDRIARHGRQQDYIRFVLPYKNKSTKGRR